MSSRMRVSDNVRRQVQTFIQVKSGDMLVAQMVAAIVTFPGQVQEGGHDVGHHPVDVESQGVQGEREKLDIIKTYNF